MVWGELNIGLAPKFDAETRPNTTICPSFRVIHNIFTVAAQLTLRICCKVPKLC